MRQEHSTARSDQRVVVVSGGGTGIGRAVGRWFAEHEDEVVLVGRRESVLEATVSELGRHARFVVADLSTAEGAFEVAKAVPEVDVIVAAAGGTRANVPVSLTDVIEEWTRDFQSNVMTSVLLIHALRPQLRSPGGRVIGLGSIGAQLGSGYSGSYGANKAALHGWIYWLATELGSVQCTANLVLPGFVPETDFFGDRATADFVAERVRRSLVGRFGTPEEIAALVGFLASPEAGYITGQIIGANGGMVLGR